MTRSRKRRGRRLITGIVVLGSLVATGVWLVGRHDQATPVAAAPVFKTAPITAGTLRTTDKIDGSVELSTSMKILHRIAGQTSSATTSASTASSPSANVAATTNANANANTNANAAATQGAAVAQGAAFEQDETLARFRTLAADLDCPAGAPTTTTSVAPQQTTTTDAVPGTDATTTPSPATTTTTTTATTPPPTTAPVGDCDVTTSSVAPAPTTTAPTGPPTTPAASSDTAPPDTATVAGTTVTGRTARGFGGRARAGTANAAGGSTTRAAGSTASAARITQTVTSVISVGAPVGLGDVLYTVDSQPVVALSGALPAWRSMSTGSTDGADVQQLEQSLVSMGYDPAGDVVVDDHFDSHTKAMVERWQKGLGATATGEVSLGSVVFVPTTTTVDSVTANVGDKVGDGDTIMTLAEASQQVVIDVPDRDQALIVPGLPVTIGSSGATGTVSVLRSAEQSGAVVVEAVITPDAPITGATNGSTIAVAVDIDSVDDALIIPAQALLSHLDGTYAVEVEAADGSVTWHDVDLLGVSGPNVGIRGDGLAAGMNVLLPV